MKRNEIIKIIKIVLNNKRSISDIEIYDTSNLRNDLGLNSFDLAELTVRIENEFDVDIFEDGLVDTVEDIYFKLKI